MRSCIFTCLFLFACGGDDGDTDYLAFRECFVEHTAVESLPVEQAIVVCALDHTVNGSTLDFATAAECEAYMDANLEDFDATTAQIMAACADYIIQKDE